MSKRVTVKKDMFDKKYKVLIETGIDNWTVVYEGTKNNCFKILVPAYKKVGYKYIDYNDYQMRFERGQTRRFV